MKSGKYKDRKLAKRLISIEFVCHGNILQSIPIGLNVYEKKNARKALKNRD